MRYILYLAVLYLYGHYNYKGQISWLLDINYAYGGLGHKCPGNDFEF